MFLRCSKRFKDGKPHHYWSIVENKRVAGGKIVQRHVLYLGEINDSQREGWRKSIEVFEDGEPRPRTVALFPEERIAPTSDQSIVRLRLEALALHRPPAVGRVLAGLRALRAARAGSLLGGAAAAQPQGHALGFDPPGAVRLSA